MLAVSNMTLEEFRERFAGEVTLAEVHPNLTCTLGPVDIGQEVEMYTGTCLVISHRDDGPQTFVFPFPNGDDPSAPIPSQVYEFLAGYWAF